MESSLGEALLPYQALRRHGPGVMGFRRLRSRLYNEGPVRIWPYDRASDDHTIDVLRRLRAEIPPGRLIVLWDGAPYHRAKTVWAAPASLDIHLEPLPGYSPDLMAVEPLWRWLREDVTYCTDPNACIPVAARLSKWRMGERHGARWLIAVSS